MRKITVMVALLGSVYFANAQVGIGTSSPAEASQLEIAASDKGVLIPRVELVELSSFLPITGNQAESLLVYNTISRNDVEVGYYYWSNAQWNRVINQSDLEDIVGPSEGDVIYVEEGGEFVFQYFDGTDWQTIDFSELVAANETKTFFRKVEDATTGNAQYLYFSEEAIQAWLAANPEGAVADIPDSAASATIIDVVGDVVNNFESILEQTTVYEGENITIEQIIEEIASQVDGNVIYTEVGGDMVFQYWDGTGYQTIDLTEVIAAVETKTSIIEIDGKQYYVSESYEGDTAPTTGEEEGVYEIDVIGGIINNFEEFIDSTVTVEGDEYTVEEYIQYISENAMQNGVTKIVINATTNQASFQRWNGTTWVDVDNTAFETIVTENETITELDKNETNGADGVEISYDYINETGNVQETIDMNADVLNLINNNTEIQEAITNILNQGGNVYFGDHDEDTNTPDVFYTIDINGNKQPIDISGQVLTVIENNSDEIKNILGDEYSETNITNTGDTWIDGNNIYKGVFAATITGGSANVSAIDLSTNVTTVGDVISIKILDGTTNTLINATTTDVMVTDGVLTFKIGTGNMYQVLDAGDIDVKVMVEFSAEE